MVVHLMGTRYRDVNGKIYHENGIHYALAHVSMERFSMARFSMPSVNNYYDLMRFMSEILINAMWHCC